MKNQFLKIWTLAIILCFSLLKSLAQADIASVRVQSVYVSGTITGAGEAGGITGRCDNNSPILIKDCSVDAVITGTDFQSATAGDTNTANDKVNVGGIAGSAFNATNVTVENCLVQNQIIAATAGSNELNPGGIIGYINDANDNNAVVNINNSVVAAKLTGGGNAFWGNKAPSATINVSSCHARNDAGLTNQTGGLLEPLSVLKTKELYDTTLGWDFEEIWQIKEGEFPIFKWQSYDGTGIGKVKAGKFWNVTGSNNRIEFTASEPLFLSVYDITGKTLFAGRINNQVSIPASKGIYILKLRNAGKDAVEKIIVF